MAEEDKYVMLSNRDSLIRATKELRDKVKQYEALKKTIVDLKERSAENSRNVENLIEEIKSLVEEIEKILPEISGKEELEKLRQDMKKVKKKIKKIKR